MIFTMKAWRVDSEILAWQRNGYIQSSSGFVYEFSYSKSCGSTFKTLFVFFHTVNNADYPQYLKDFLAIESVLVAAFPHLVILEGPKPTSRRLRRYFYGMRSDPESGMASRFDRRFVFDDFGHG